ncbi:MAG TPA: molybdopterin-dependent oxidoreductase [Dehalococcoidales bacterium]
MIRTKLGRPQIAALWNLSQSASIPQSEFFDILNRTGPSGLLAKCIERGTLRSTKPVTAEMSFELMANMGYYTTSNSLFFTCARKPAPLTDIQNWRLTVEGDGVGNPFSISYDELLKLPSVTFTRFLECAGNGRIFYDVLLGKKAAGPQWHFGGYGIAEWTGVQLSKILKIAKIRKEAVEVMPIGTENSPGQHPIPLAKALEKDTLLAYVMNGNILPQDHGFPLRALVPGWVGEASTKWVNKVIVSTHPIHVNPSQKGPAITTQVMKSACCLPWPATLRAGHQKIVGYAWSPSGKITKVDVSLDGGTTFLPACLTGPNVEKAGSRWEFCFDAQPGNLTITPRATDDRGNIQFDISRQKWSASGYLFGAATPHPVTISAHSGESYSGQKDYSPVIGQCC